MINVAADAVVFNENGAGEITHVLAIRRKNSPYEGLWALPGGFVNEDEDLPDAALRELKEETGLAIDRVWQVGAWGRPGRDPRGRVISVAYFGIVNGLPEVAAADDALEASWLPLGLAREERNNPLAFDHREIIERAYLISIG